MIVIDILRRLAIDVDVLACHEECEIVSYFNVTVQANHLLSAKCHLLYDAIVLPGGPQGARNLGASVQVVDFVSRHLNAEKWVCALCSAGAHVLSANGLLAGRKYTCSGDSHTLYSDGIYVNQPIVEDGPLLTGQGLGYAFQFAFDIGARLVDPKIVREQAEHVYVSWKMSEPV